MFITKGTATQIVISILWKQGSSFSDTDSSICIEIETYFIVTSMYINAWESTVRRIYIKLKTMAISGERSGYGGTGRGPREALASSGMLSFFRR